MDSPLATALITGCVYLVVLAATLSHHNPSDFIKVGAIFAVPAELHHGIVPLANQAGYDGQFAYRLALDPFTTKWSAHGVAFDFPSMRHQRLTYPFLVWLATAGDPGRVPAGLIFVNYAALSALGFIGGSLARMAARHALWGLMFPLSPGLLLTLRLDLNEIVAMAFLFAGILLLEKTLPGWAAPCFALALMSRETTLIAIGSILLVFLYDLWRRSPRDNGHGWSCVVAILLWAIFQFALARVWHEIPFLVGIYNLGVPLKAYATYFRQALSLGWRLRILEMSYVSCFAGLVLWTFRKTRPQAVHVLAWMLYFALALSLNHWAWSDDWSFLRVMPEFFLFGWLLLLRSESRMRIPAAAVTVTVWAAVAVYRF